MKGIFSFILYRLFPTKNKNKGDKLREMNMFAWLLAAGHWLPSSPVLQLHTITSHTYALWGLGWFPLRFHDKNMTLFNLLVTPQFVSVKYNFDLKSSVWDESDMICWDKAFMLNSMNFFFIKYIISVKVIRSEHTFSEHLFHFRLDFIKNCSSVHHMTPKFRYALETWALFFYKLQKNENKN